MDWGNGIQVYKEGNQGTGFKLIRAAAEAGEDETIPPPRLVTEEILRRSLGVPWKAGGLGDQPYRKTLAAAAALNVFNAHRAYLDTQLDGVEFSKRHPGAWDIITKVNNL